MGAGAAFYGTWEDIRASTEPVLSRQQMTLTASQLTHAWRRCSLSSDFWARYISLFASSPPFQIEEVRLESLESTISYLLNELFENCAKFSRGPLDIVQYRSWILPSRMVFQISNHIQPGQRAPFVRRIKELLSGDPDELYFQKLEENATGDGTSSGLGYLTLMKDYHIRFGFSFTPISETTSAVDTQAHIDLKEL